MADDEVDEITTPNKEHEKKARQDRIKQLENEIFTLKRHLQETQKELQAKDAQHRDELISCKLQIGAAEGDLAYARQMRAEAIANLETYKVAKLETQWPGSGAYRELMYQRETILNSIQAVSDFITRHIDDCHIYGPLLELLRKCEKETKELGKILPQERNQNNKQKCE